ncbi:MAG: flagellar filament capping protein FliD [Terriglobales bacterium]
MASVNLSQSTATQGTGIDVTSVVDQIIFAEQAPERIWQQQQIALAAQASSLNSLSSGVNALKDKVLALTDLSGAFAGQTVTTSQPSLVTASAQSGAAIGVHTLVVNGLATVSSYYTDPVTSSSTTLTHGSFNLSVGQGSNTITIDGTNDTLDELSAYINAHNYGVQASVLNDGGGARLALVSKTSGVPGDLNVTANNTGLVFHKSAAGVNSDFTLDGVPLSSSTNTVSSALPNVTLNLLGADPNTPVTLTVAHDTAGITQAINDFVSAYNSVIGSINAQFKSDAAGNAGPIASNSALRRLQSSLLSDVTYSITGNNGLVNLAALGVDMQNDGTMTVDSAKLNSALSSQFSDLQAFFQSVNAGGFGNHFSNDLTALTDSTAGSLSLNLNENASNQKALTNQINDFEARLADRRQFLVNQYSRVDAMLRQYPLILQQIQSQLGALSGK